MLEAHDERTPLVGIDPVAIPLQKYALFNVDALDFDLQTHEAPTTILILRCDGMHVLQCSLQMNRTFESTWWVNQFGL